MNPTAQMLITDQLMDLGKLWIPICKSQFVMQKSIPLYIVRPGDHAD